MRFRQFIESIDLEYHDELNPALWNEFKLNPIVRDKLLLIAEKWKNYVELSDDDILDIYMTGGNANFNYTGQSDIDLHLLVDMKKINPTNDMKITEYFMDKKALWQTNHDIKILGYPIEPYVQDINEKTPFGQGVFSLMNNKWIQKPVNMHFDWNHDPKLEKKIEHYKHTIDFILKHDLGYDKMHDLKDKVRDMRASSIAKDGEFAFENLVFKSLRNQGYLDKMNSYLKNKEDTSLSM